MVSIREGPESSVMIVLDELLNCLVLPNYVGENLLKVKW